MEILYICAFWALVLWGLFVRPDYRNYLLFGAVPFGAFATLPPAISGGLTLTPAPMVLALIIGLWVLQPRSWPTLGRLLSLDKLSLLLLFYGAAAIVTLFAPRLFRDVEVILLSDAELGWLAPTTQNFSQTVYLGISVLAVFHFATVLRHPTAMTSLLRGLVFGALVAVATGVIDRISKDIDLTFLLDPLRTATYAILTEQKFGDVARIAGLMPEPSAFAGVLISFLSIVYFFREPLRHDPVIRPYVTVAIVGLVAMVWLSTSSTGFASTVVLAAVAALEAVQDIMRGRDQKRKAALAKWFAVAVLIGAPTVCGLLLLRPPFVEAGLDLINEVLFEKTKSDSYEERSMWTSVSWNALWATYGFGVGLGGTRPSNGLVAIASNSGVVATVALAALVALHFTRKVYTRTTFERRLLRASRLAIWAPLSAFALSGTTPDFGFFLALLLAVPCALSLRQENGAGIRGPAGWGGSSPRAFCSSPKFERRT